MDKLAGVSSFVLPRSLISRIARHPASPRHNQWSRNHRIPLRPYPPSFGLDVWQALWLFDALTEPRDHGGDLRVNWPQSLHLDITGGNFTLEFWFPAPSTFFLDFNGNLSYHSELTSMML